MNDQQQYEAAAAELQTSVTGTPVEVSALGHRLLGEFSRAEMDRKLTEMRWLEDIRQYRGQYNPEELALIGANRSKSFVRKTRVKIKTIDSRVADLLFPAGSEKNWEVDTTPVPSVSREMRAQVKAELAQMAQASGGQVTKKMVDEAVLEVCKRAAKEMAKVIDDQLVESRYKQACLRVIHSGHLYGTGILKGPLVEKKVRTKFVQQGGNWVARSESYVVPFVEHVPIWRFYPDMNATELDQCRYIWERHSFTQAQLASLAERRSFDGDCIREHIAANPEGRSTNRYFDNELKVIGERTANQGATLGQYEVLERWGWLSGEELRQAGVDVPPERVHESFFSNVWVLPTGQVIKSVLQPINGVTWPYHLYYFDKDESSIFGEGLATVMRDDQKMLNAAVRMMLDNAALTAGAMLEIAPQLLNPMEDIEEIRPFKIWMRNTASPGQRAVNTVTVESRLQELEGMARMFENNTDEVTAIPRYMSGESVSSGAAGTASGMSMLMGAANIVIKDLISAWDEGITRPFITALYLWNMQWNPRKDIKGDFDVKARGTSSLVAKEVRARSLLEFGASVANPMDAPYIKRDVLLRQRAEATELAGVVKTEDEVKAEAENPQMQAQAQLAQMQAQLAMAELEKKVGLLVAQTTKALADAELVKARAISEKVGAVYSALQAGGVATQTPYIAPAGDEILKSAGWIDKTPDPGIDALNGPPVQDTQGTSQVIGANQQFAQEPRGPQEGLQQGIETPGIDG